MLAPPARPPPRDTHVPREARLREVADEVKAAVREETRRRRLVDAFDREPVREAERHRGARRAAARVKEPLRRATKLGVDAPRLHMLAALLDIINEKQ